VVQPLNVKATKADAESLDDLEHGTALMPSADVFLCDNNKHIFSSYYNM
jgi:hypothetical protein